MQTQEIIIHGTTSNGKVFRPSDWAERLCGILSSFNKDNRLAYHEWVHPILIDKIRCVAISAKLEEINPAMFRFLMDFAADNDLRIIPAEEFNQQSQTESTPAITENIPTATKNTPSSAKEDYQPTSDVILTEAVADAKTHSSSIREITANETTSAFAALSVLRPMLNDINRFVEQVNNVQRTQGYRLLGVFEEGKSNAVAVCGFREETNLVSGRHLHIDDLVTVPNCRGRGYAAMLLNAVREIAIKDGITCIEADSNVGNDRTHAHRLYFQNGFAIQAYHFIYKTK